MSILMTEDRHFKCQINVSNGIEIQVGTKSGKTVLLEYKLCVQEKLRDKIEAEATRILLKDSALRMKIQKIYVLYDRHYKIADISSRT